MSSKNFLLMLINWQHLF